MQPACGSNNLKVVDVANMGQMNQYLLRWFYHSDMNVSAHTKAFGDELYRQREPSTNQ